MRKDLPVYRHQLYIYGQWCKEHFGQYPAKLSFNLFKENMMVDEEFSEEALEETRQWILDTIREIEVCDLFENWKTPIALGETKEPYACRWICGTNSECADYQEVRQRSLEEWKAKKQLEEAMLNGY